VLATGCVTEDYILGIEAKRAGFKSAFAAVSESAARYGEFVATREFFPQGFAASVRQKTRWVFGINFEAMRRLGWRGDAWDIYFFVRDRKGMVTNFLPPVSLVFLGLLLCGSCDMAYLPPDLQPVFSVVLSINLVALVSRYLIRMSAFKRVYGRYDALGVMLRWPVGVVVNAIAVLHAWRTYLFESAMATKPIAWAKTEHEVPMDFAA
jgi:glycosyl transferase family 2